MENDGITMATIEIAFFLWKIHHSMAQHPLSSYQIGPLPTAYYVPEYITHQEEEELINQVRIAVEFGKLKFDIADTECKGKVEDSHWP